jgi:integrase/recombinase XerC
LTRYLRARKRHSQSELPALWLGSTGQGRLFHNGMRAMLSRRAAEAGIGHVHPHMFRHAFAHYWQAEGGNDSDLMRIMGWKSREMLLRYGASAADERAHASARRLRLDDRV